MAKTWHCIVAFLVTVIPLAIAISRQQLPPRSQQGDNDDEDQQQQQHHDEPMYPQELVFCKPTLVSEERVAPRHSQHSSTVLVSTLDGQLSAVDVQTGQLKWTMMTGPGSMLSSSISKLEISSQGQWIRLIPSLEGNLYKFDGQHLEALPVTADSLLSNSLKLADDIIITGGKDNRVYGLDFTTGKLKYICSMMGCQFFGNEIINQANLLIIRRFTNTVRAIDPMTGLEKWNYSVGQLEVDFPKRPPDIVCDHQHKKSEHDRAEDDDEYSWMNDEPDDGASALEPEMKITTPQGTVQALARDGRSSLLWQQQFDSPIANAWMLRDGAIEKINLLENVHRSHFNNDFSDEVLQTASLYLGVHSQQYYIQQSPEIYQKVAKANLLYTLDGNTAFPRIQWKPYLVTAVSRTPIITSSHQLPSVNLVGPPHRSEEVTALMVRQESDYPYDGGYYIFPEETRLDSVFLLTHEEDEPETVQQIIIISLWYWWKEILGIAVLTFVCNYFFTRCVWKWMRNRAFKKAAKQITETSVLASEDNMNSASKESNATQEEDTEPIKAVEMVCSRYYDDFEPIRRLGKGGFGVVFQAMNKIDDCEYAVKRICLPTKKEAREKVKREVKALAKLDHVAIVRYYNAWEETPPVGWQERQDRLLEERTSSATPCISSELSTEHIGNDPAQHPNTRHPERDPNRMNNNTSKGFGVKPADIDSGSFSLDPSDWSKLHDAKFHFGTFPAGAGDCLSSESCSEPSLPFRRYGLANADASGDDSFIVFEKSGGGDESARAPNGEISSCGQDDNVTSAESSHPTREGCVRTSKGSTVGELPAQSKKEGRTYLYIQMQLCRKENLKDWLCANTEPRSKLQMLDFFDQIVSAVEYVHNEGLMHRDLKPSNIFFSVDGTIKVGDFGLVTTMAESSDEHTPCELVPSKKHTNQVGTQLYMSPEQIMGLPYNYKVDIFSLGLIFFELMVPFGTQMERQQVMLNVKQHVFPEDFLRDHPEESAFVKKLLSHKPEDRPAATDIKQDPLLQAFQPRPEVLRHRRSRTLSRTYSTSSSGSFE